MRLIMVGKIMLVTALTISLVSCGGGSDVVPVTTAPAATTVTGSAGDGPVTGGAVTVTDANGAAVITTPANPTTGTNAKFNFTVPSGTALPLTITVAGGTDTVTGRPQDFPLQTAVTTLPAGGSVTGNANPLSTLAVASAVAQGGGILTTANLGTATTNILNSVGFGLIAGVNPLSTPIDINNVASVVRANEAAAEMIRRASNASGGTLANTIISIAQDLTDGTIDGQVAPGANNTQVNNANASHILNQQAQVSAESLSNNLTVTAPNGTTLVTGANSATALNATMTNTINLAGDVNTEAPTQAFLDQTRSAINIANTLAGGNNAALNNLLGGVNALTAGSTPTTAQQQDITTLTTGAATSFTNASAGANTPATANNATIQSTESAADTTAPAVPIITTPNADITTQTTTLTVTGTAETGALVTVLSGTSGSLGTVAANGAVTGAVSAWTISVTGLVDGAHAITAIASDAAGNTSVTSATAAIITVDNTGPSVVISTTSPVLTNASPIPVTLTFNEPATGVLLADIAVINGVAANFVAVSTTVFTADITPVVDGAVTVDVAANAATDALGNNSSAAIQLSVTFDSTAPSAPGITVPVASSVTNSTTLNVSGGSEANATIKLYDGNVLLGTATASGAGAWSLTTGVLAEGAYNLAATATDAAGNTSNPSVVILATIDTTIPVIALVGANPVTLNTSGAYSDAGATASDTLDGVLTGSIVVNASNVNVNAAGTYTVSYDVSDAAGNAATTVTRSVVVTAIAASQNQIAAGDVAGANTTYLNMLIVDPTDIEAAIGASMTAMVALADNQALRTLATQFTTDAGATLPTGAATLQQLNSATPVANPILINWVAKPNRLVNTAVTANQLQDPSLDPVIAELSNAITRIEAVKAANFTAQFVQTKNWDVADIDGLLGILYGQRGVIRWARAYNWNTTTMVANVPDLIEVPVADPVTGIVSYYTPASVDPVSVLNDPGFFTLQGQGTTLLAGAHADFLKAAQMDVAFQTAMLNSPARRADATHPFLAMTQTKPTPQFDQFGQFIGVWAAPAQPLSNATLQKGVLDGQHTIAALDTAGAGLNVNVTGSNGVNSGPGVVTGHKAFIGATPLKGTMLATFEYVDLSTGVGVPVVPNLALSQKYNTPVISERAPTQLSPFPLPGEKVIFSAAGVAFIKAAGVQPVGNGTPVNDATLGGVLSPTIALDQPFLNQAAAGAPTPMVYTYP